MTRTNTVHHVDHAARALDIDFVGLPIRHRGSAAHDRFARGYRPDVNADGRLGIVDLSAGPALLESIVVLSPDVFVHGRRETMDRCDEFLFEERSVQRSQMSLSKYWARLVRPVPRWGSATCLRVSGHVVAKSHSRG